MIEINDAQALAKEIKEWAQAELDKINAEYKFLSTITARESKYTEMDNIITQAKEEG